jgi:hypothetical protein
MTKTFTKALLSGVAVAIVASLTVAANAQCAWPNMDGRCLVPPPGGSIISYPTGPWERQAYVPGNFPSADTIHLSQ